MSNTCSFFCSIVVPVFNKSKFIGKALESVLSQSFHNFEVIIVDDGSTDGSAAVVRNINDPRVKLFVQQNSGVSVARNIGIQHARGELVFFFDADDWMHKDYLRTQVNQAIKYPHVSFFATRFLRFNSELLAPESWTIVLPVTVVIVNDLPTVWSRGQTFITSAVAIRQRTLLAMQPCFPPGESKGEDMDLWFRLAELGPLCLTDTPLIGYRDGTPGNLTSQNAGMLFPPYLQRLDKRAHSGQLTPSLSRSTLRFIAEARITKARMLLMQGQRLAAVSELMLATAAVKRQRWWLSWLMVIAFTSRAVESWEQSRILRTQVRI
jgi:hypothetical protein